MEVSSCSPSIASLRAAAAAVWMFWVSLCEHRVTQSVARVKLLCAALNTALM